MVRVVVACRLPTIHLSDPSVEQVAVLHGRKYGGLFIVSEAVAVENRHPDPRNHFRVLGGDLLRQEDVIVRDGRVVSAPHGRFGA